MTTKYWDILLTKWREQKRDGFTIPFIIGSQKYLPKNHTYQDIPELINDILKTETTEIYISYCPDIGDNILGIRDASKSQLKGLFPLFANNPQTSLYLTMSVDYLGKNIEQILSSLQTKYDADIASGKFSLNDGVTGDFSPKEIEFIKNCYSHLK